jgi:hypothetical protein
MTDESKRVYELLAKDHPTVDEFKVLLEHVAPGVLAKRFLASGLPYVFKDKPHKYLAFREAIGNIFGVLPQNVAVMGSARFGFSTSPRKQTHKGAKPLGADSDMDLVIISHDLSTQATESFVRYVFDGLRGNLELRSNAKNETEKVSMSKELMLAFRRRAKALFFGYVSPSDLPDGSQEKQHFYDMQREAATQLFGTAPPGPINRIGARIYRDWDSAERSYEFSFKRLTEVLGLSYEEHTELEDEDV